LFKDSTLSSSSRDEENLPGTYQRERTSGLSFVVLFYMELQALRVRLT
jgi:hypothetical protein